MSFSASEAVEMFISDLDEIAGVFNDTVHYSDIVFLERYSTENVQLLDATLAKCTDDLLKVFESVYKTSVLNDHLTTLVKEEILFSRPLNENDFIGLCIKALPKALRTTLIG